jgi:phosphoribosylanthranilate isomerase
MTFVKVCGITSVEDAIAAASAGANMLGFVFAESPRRADPATVKHITRILGGDVKTVGVFTDESDEVLQTMDNLDLTYAQLHGMQSEEFAQRIGGGRVIRAIRVRNEGSINLLADFQEAAYYLLDTYKAGMAGGTGEVFDWSIAAAAKSFGKPLLLSGGLTPENVAEAIATARPFAVDASSGLEQSPGIKDHNKVKEFIANVRRADAASG